MPGPLSGVRVIDLTSVVLGPVATQLLGDLGADVIKVEPPEGDAIRVMGPSRHPGMGPIFLANNRNKRSIVLDLKTPEGRDAFGRLVDTADVFVHNMRTKAAERLGIGYRDLAATNPKLIYASSTGYKLDGPLSDRPAYDDVIQGASGIPDLYVKTGREAQYAPFAAADKVAGYVLAMSVGMALFERERSGAGQEVHVPMLETLVSFNLHEHFWGGIFDPPLGPFGYSRMATPHRRPFETADGHICVMAVTDAQWNRLLLAVERPDLAADDRFARMAQRGAHFDALYLEVSAEIRKRTTAEWTMLFDRHDIPCGPAPQLEDLLADEYFLSTGFFRKVEHPTEGRLVSTSVPVSYSRTPGSIRSQAPNLGEHTEAILRELGYETGEIERIMGGGARGGRTKS